MEDVGLAATLTTARGGRVASPQTTRVAAEPGQAGFTVRLPLDGLAPGEYVLTLDARAGRRSTARQVAFAVVD